MKHCRCRLARIRQKRKNFAANTYILPAFSFLSILHSVENSAMADIDAPNNHDQQNGKPKAELITVQVKSGGDGVEVYFKIKKTTHFRKVSLPIRFASFAAASCPLNAHSSTICSAGL
jgi:hypothetical protein